MIDRLPRAGSSAIGGIADDPKCEMQQARTANNGTIQSSSNMMSIDVENWCFYPKRGMQKLKHNFIDVDYLVLEGGLVMNTTHGYVFQLTTNTGAIGKKPDAMREIALTCYDGFPIIPYAVWSVRQSGVTWCLR